MFHIRTIGVRLGILLTLLFPTIVTAQSVSFRASAPSAVVSGQRFQIVYTVNERGKDLRAPDFTGFSVLFGPASSMSTSVQMVNGRTTTEVTNSFTYTLLAEKEGEFTIGGATIRVDDRQYTSNGLTIKVLPPDKASAQQGGGASGRGGAQQGNTGGGISSDMVFVKLSASKRKVYEQEGILLSFKVYTRTQNLNFESLNFPTFEGFAVQEVDLGQQSYTLENYNGVNYNVATIRQYWLFPQRAGKIEIAPGKFDIVTQVRRQSQSNDIFEQFFGSGVQELRKTLYSDKVTIDVAPLPAGRPASFMGAVGTYTMQSSINRQTLKANEAITVKVVIKGNGNVKFAKTPELTFPNDFEGYDPKIDLSVKATSQGVEGTKTIEYTAIPRFAGQFTLPAVEFSYFDPSTARYMTLRAPAYEIQVQPGAADGTTPVGGGSYVNKEELRLLNEDIRYIKTGNLDLSMHPVFFYGSVAYWLLFILPLGGLFLFIILYRKQLKENADVALRRTRKANKVAAKRLKLAGKLLQQGEKAAFYEEILRAVWGYISDKLTIPMSKLTKENVTSELLQYGVSSEVTQKILEVLDTCEFARYAPVQGEGAMDEIYRKTLEIIDDMENIHKKKGATPLRTMMLIGWLLMGSMALQAQSLADSANMAYQQERYQDAIIYYSRAIDTEGISSNIYYNLGNAYYKSKQYAPAILNYERALLLNPANDDARFNLELARARIVDKITPIGKVFWIDWIEALANLLSSNGWAWVSVIAFVFAVVAIVFFLLSRRLFYKKVSFYKSIVLVVIALISLLFAKHQYDRVTNRDEVIVFAPTVSIKSTPAQSGTDLFLLHEGTKATLVDRVGAWYEIVIPDGNRGWIEASKVEVI